MISVNKLYKEEDIFNTHDTLDYLNRYSSGALLNATTCPIAFCYQHLLLLLV
jgi:hypothetical protein